MFYAFLFRGIFFFVMQRNSNIDPLQLPLAEFTETRRVSVAGITGAKLVISMCSGRASFLFPRSAAAAFRRHLALPYVVFLSSI